MSIVADSLTVPRAARPTPRGTLGSALRALGLAALAGLALYFVARWATHYFVGDSITRSSYARYPALIRVHIVTGAAALFAGLVQLRTGPRRTRLRQHRWLGRVYLAAVLVSAVAAALLIVLSRKPWVFRAGLAGLIVAWLGTSGLAYAAIRRGLVTQHREWMVRSYVVTFAFVTFRVITDVLRAYHAGTRAEQIGFAAWACWAVPLLVAELVLQGRKILAARPPRRRSGSPASAGTLVAAP